MRFLFTILSFFFTSVMMAVPAHRSWFSYQQTDGTFLELMPIGDEHFHYYITRDYVPVVDENDAFYYAKVENGKMMATSLLVHEQNRRTIGERMAAEKAKSAFREVDFKRASRPHRLPRQSNGAYIGSRKGLIILANFEDVKFEGYSEQSVDSIRQAYDDLVNLPGYTNSWGAIGSVHDYYYDQSNGLFDLEFDVVGPVNLSRPASFYGKNQFGFDINAGHMVVECCEAVDSQVNFADYDWDDDGNVEEVFVLYAGRGESTGGGTSTIWPHMWTLEESHAENEDIPEQIVLDDRVVNVYACSNEIYKPGIPMGLGVICHEFAHCLGLPDLYDTNTGNNYGMGNWSILDKGTYNGPNYIGWVPAGFTSYERNFVGWLDYTPLENDTVVENMIPINEQDAKAYIIVNDSTPTEYYLLENRNNTRWDSYIPGKGLLIMHVDFDQELWDANYVNATGYLVGNDHPRLTIFHADGSEYSDDDTYPYLDNDSLTDNSTPQAFLYNPNVDEEYLMHKPITHIAWDDSTATISFQFQNLVIWPNPDAIVEEMSIKHNHASKEVYRLDGTRLNTFDGAINEPSQILIYRNEDGKATKKVIKR
ncbi:MAG: M6 family metalloprotease domain-containing protein [Prevotella sp.]|nr:M6 family metalloprotease domain-containing protein [Prevotella sp.]